MPYTKQPPPVVHRERVTSFVGTGCAIQGLGIAAPFILGFMFGSGGTAVGAVIFVVLLFVGSAKAISWRCGACKNPLAGKEVRMCPTCGSTFE